MRRFNSSVFFLNLKLLSNSFMVKGKKKALPN